MTEVKKHLEETMLENWEVEFKDYLKGKDADAAHDVTHAERVVANAKKLANGTTANMHVLVPAAWLHDCACIPKDSPLRSQSALLSAATAITFLLEAGGGYWDKFIPDIHHAITSHSYSGNTTPMSLEANILYDADKLDALGAVGIARTFVVGGSLGRKIYNPDSPFPDKRMTCEAEFCLDHFYSKLLHLEKGMKTDQGRKEAIRRTNVMRDFWKTCG